MLIQMANKEIPIYEVVSQMMKYTPVWTNRNHVVIYSDNYIDLEDGKVREVIAEYPVNKAKLKKYILDKIG